MLNERNSAGVNAGAAKEEIAQWAKTGRVRYARWDGGPLEAAKAVLSGWYYMPEPRAMEATVNWYEDSHSLELLLAANINWIWVTYSNGFSMKSEYPVHRQLERFVRCCHEYGIHVTAYMSMVNLFIDDMRRNEPDVDDWLQRDINGRAVPYGAARYVGEPTRLLACMNHPGWRKYLGQRVSMALDIGIDGLMYDNQWTACRCGRCTESWNEFQRSYTQDRWPWPDEPSFKKLLPEEQSRLVCAYDRYCIHVYESIYNMVREIALPRNPHFLIYGNFNTGYNTYTVPANNAVSTEDGAEPGIVEGKLVQNFGYLRCLSGAGAGWRPVRMESGTGRGRGQLAKKIDAAGVGATRFVPMEPIKHQLSMAEAHALGVSFQITPEGEFLRDLYFREPESMKNWSAIARYNGFFAVHEDLYADVTTAASIVSVHNTCFRRACGDDFAQRPALIGELAKRGIVLDVRYDRDLNDSLLEPYDVMLLADTRVFNGNMAETIRNFAGRGGRIVATGSSGRYDDRFVRRQCSLLDEIPGVRWLDDPAANIASEILSDGQTNVYQQWPANPADNLDSGLLDRLAAVLREMSHQIVEIECPGHVLYNLTRDKSGRLLVHLLNYDDGYRPSVILRLTGGHFKITEWFSPDEPVSAVDVIDSGTVCIRGLSCYGVLRCLTAGEKDRKFYAGSTYVC